MGISGLFDTSVSFEFATHHYFCQECNHVDLLVHHKRTLVLILCNNEHRFRDGLTIKVGIKIVIDLPHDIDRLVIHILSNPLLHVGKLFTLEVLHQRSNIYIVRSTKNSNINSTRRRVSLQLIESASEVREIFLDNLSDNLLLILDILLIENVDDSTKECSSNLLFILTLDTEVNYRAT